MSHQHDRDLYPHDMVLNFIRRTVYDVLRCVSLQPGIFPQPSRPIYGGLFDAHVWYSCGYLDRGRMPGARASIRWALRAKIKLGERMLSAGTIDSDTVERGRTLTRLARLHLLGLEDT